MIKGNRGEFPDASEGRGGRGKGEEEKRGEKGMLDVGKEKETMK